MSTMQQAFQQVGYKPSGVRLRTLRRAAERGEIIQVRQRDVRRTIEREKITATLEQCLDGLLAPITKNRKIITIKAGGFVKARYEGRRAYVFGYDQQHAKSRLKTWDE